MKLQIGLVQRPDCFRYQFHFQFRSLRPFTSTVMIEISLTPLAISSYASIKEMNNTKRFLALKYRNFEILQK